MANAARLPAPFRICLDINVWVAAEFGKLHGRNGTVAQKMVSLVASKHLDNRPLQLVVGVEMISTLGKVLVRHGVSIDVAAEYGAKIIDLMKSGPESLDPLLLLSGRDQIAMHDREDAGVLATAFAARVDLLVTDNLKDFATSDSICFKTRMVRPAAGERQLMAIIHERQDGVSLVVAHPLDVREWVRGGLEISAQGIRLAYGGKKI